jgi:hypothetical protein
MQAGMDGLLSDKTRPSRQPPLAAEVIGRVIDLTAAAPPGEATHWTGSAMAEMVGISVSSVQRICRRAPSSSAGPMADKTMKPIVSQGRCASS